MCHVAGAATYAPAQEDRKLESPRGTITYANSSDAPPASVTIDWTFSDGNAGAQGTGGALAATGSTTVSITAVTNAAPSTPTDSDAATNSVVEGAAIGTTVGITASAIGVNGGTITYSLIDDAGGRFAIDPNTGMVTVADGTLLGPCCVGTKKTRWTGLHRANYGNVLGRTSKRNNQRLMTRLLQEPGATAASRTNTWKGL